MIGESPPADFISSDLEWYFVLNRDGRPVHSGGRLEQSSSNINDLFKKIPQIEYHLDNPDRPGGFYQIPKSFSAVAGTVYIGPLPDREKFLIACFNGDPAGRQISKTHSGLYFLSLIAQTIRAFHDADDLEDILRIVLTGVTAGTGLGFNRAFVFLTEVVDARLCLVGKHAIGPASPEEAGQIWGKLSSGEITLEQMFNDLLQEKNNGDSPLNRLISGLVISLDGHDNIFARAAREKKSMLIDETVLGDPDYREFRERLGSGPMAFVPLVGKESLQGVIIADNHITKKPIAKTDLQLLDIFARYASDSIEKFRLYESLEGKIRDLEMANRTIVLSRENLLKAERLSVLAEMAGQVAHEIRNPLTVIGGFAKSMIRKMPGTHENYENLNIIVEQVGRIEVALNRFTSLVNYQSKNDQYCELENLIESSIHLRAGDAAGRRFELIKNEPIMILTDPDLFRQAIFLILQQAGAISENRGKIAIRLEKSEGRAIVRIESEYDAGTFAERLYRSFSSAQSLETTRRLAVALEILKYYQGNIGLEISRSNIPQFYIEIPCREEVG